MSSTHVAASRRAIGTPTHLRTAWRSRYARPERAFRPAWADGEDRARVMDTVVVTASGFEQQIQDAPASISVITRQDLKRSSTAT